MAAYEAVVTLNHSTLTVLNQTGIWLSKYHPSFFETLQYVGKELKPFQEFVEGLDVKSRRRMKVELQRVTQATNQFRETLGDASEKLLIQPEVMLDQSDINDAHELYAYELDSEQQYRDLEEFRQMARSFVDTLKEVEEEYLKVQDEDEDEAPVDLGGMVVGLSDVYSELKRVVVSTEVHDHVVLLCGMAGIGYPWEEASMISSLPNLEALKLRNNAFKGPEWAVEDYAFPKLSCLVMEDLDLMILKGGYASFILLNKVSIKHCYNLKTFRLTDDYSFLADSSELEDCNPLVGREIQKSVIQSSYPRNYLSIKSSWNS